MKLKPNIACFIILERDNQILIAKRVWWFSSWLYNFPSGHLEDGESLEETAIRETKEEIWVSLKKGSLTLKHILHWQNLEMPYIYFYWSATEWEWEPTICEPDKCSDLKRVSYDEIEKYPLTPGDLKAIQSINKGILISTYISDTLTS
jgi:8-oxo-dGTP pyrophosphatase MutT (NUDIX family)